MGPAKHAKRRERDERCGLGGHVTSRDPTLDAGRAPARSGVACPKNVQRQYLTGPSELVPRLFVSFVAFCVSLFAFFCKPAPAATAPTDFPNSRGTGIWSTLPLVGHARQRFAAHRHDPWIIPRDRGH